MENRKRITRCGVGGRKPNRGVKSVGKCRDDTTRVCLVHEGNDDSVVLNSCSAREVIEIYQDSEED
jgi:hypothetical protein